MPIRVSLEWLREYVELPEDAERLAEALTLSGSKVDRVIAVGQGWEGVVVARIAELAPVPGSDHLLLARVEHGGASSQVVSGAPNLRVGDLVPLATVGTILPNGMTIKARKMLGAPSEGMLCSPAELGISTEADGIMVLGTGGPTGMPLADLMPPDHLLIVDVTPNRPDELCHLGVARELAAVLGRELRAPDALPEEAGAAALSVEIRDPDLCARYVAREVFGLRVGPSPGWMQRRLRAVGQRPINNVVDAANYVMLELGQPLHAFDRDRLAGRAVLPEAGVPALPGVGAPARLEAAPALEAAPTLKAAPSLIVRRARAGESLACLDGRTRELPEGALLIADPERPQAIAGIIGGAASAVGDATTSVVIESANFLGTSIRATSRRLGLRTEASGRFEKQLAPALAPLGAARLAALLREVAGAGPSSPAVDVHPAPRERAPIRLRVGFVTGVLGEDLGGPARAEAEIRARLERLGFGVDGDAVAPPAMGGAAVETPPAGPTGAAEADGPVLTVTPPPFRLDVGIPEDLVEEVGRLRGYANLPSTLPGRRQPVARVLPPADVEWEARDLALAGGYDEVVGLSFGNPRDPLMGHPPTDRQVLLLNPMTSEQDRMRISLLPGLTRIVERNNDVGNEAVRIFELGRVFWPRDGSAPPDSGPAGASGTPAITGTPDDRFADRRRQDLDLPRERRMLGFAHQVQAATGRKADEQVRDALLATKGVIEDISRSLSGVEPGGTAGAGLRLEVEQERVHGLRPGRSARLWLVRRDAAGAAVGERALFGWLGEVHPEAVRGMDLRAPLVLAEVDFDLLAANLRLPVAESLSRFPAVSRDIAISVPTTRPARDVLRTIRDAGEAILRTVNLFDEYHGSQLPAGRKGLAVHLVYAAPDRTLTGDEVAAAEARILARLGAEVEAEVRAR
ncbi:MAG TPA: phenylalanine--tRNA ligase subunit beta [Candidatus Dormibacteraeota bacterium]|nr:phenylalanine--tRNA ligase subunit beta [Candidatus Dormibacteraeota bacterium]